MRSGRWTAIAATAMAIILGLAAGPATGASPSQAPRAAPAGSISGDGTYRVGSEVRPGTYVSRPAGSFGGYWERLKCATGELDCILANGNTSGQVFVTILPTDKFFSSSRMHAWRPAGAVKPAKPASRFAGDGMYRVGVDIRPGTYRTSSSGALGGYWERLACATGVLDCILANDNAKGQVLVEILPTDTYFTSSRMRNWLRIAG